MIGSDNWFLSKPVKAQSLADNIIMKYQIHESQAGMLTSLKVSSSLNNSNRQTL